MWSRPHVGGLFDLEVIDADSRQVYWKHLEGPSPDALARAWEEMLEAFRKLS